MFPAWADTRPAFLPFLPASQKGLTFLPNTPSFAPPVPGQPATWGQRHLYLSWCRQLPSPFLPPGRSTRTFPTTPPHGRVPTGATGPPFHACYHLPHATPTILMPSPHTTTPSHWRAPIPATAPPPALTHTTLLPSPPPHANTLPLCALFGTSYHAS